MKKSIVPNSICATIRESEVVALAHSHLVRCMSKVLPSQVPLRGWGLFILLEKSDEFDPEVRPPEHYAAEVPECI